MFDNKWEGFLSGLNLRRKNSWSFLTDRKRFLKILNLYFCCCNFIQEEENKLPVLNSKTFKTYQQHLSFSSKPATFYSW